MTKIDPFSLTTVPLQQYANGMKIGDATGFVWRRHDRNYLITNWHVVTGRHAVTGELKLVIRPEMLRAYFNTKVMDFGKISHDIQLRDADCNPIWFIESIRRRTDDTEECPAPFLRVRVTDAVRYVNISP
jgi:hypothetical protein